MNSTSKTPKVWASLITNTEYLPGLLTLDYSLKTTGTRYPFVALYTDEFPEEGHKALDARGILKRKIEFIAPEGQKDYPHEPRFAYTWTKLTVFRLLEYERVVLLDGDMLVRQNMDELMDLPLDSAERGGNGNRVFAAAPACVCNPAKKGHYPADWKPENCAYTSQHADAERAQTSGAQIQGHINMLNSGLLVVVPSQAVFNTISEKMLDVEALQTYMFPDQALLSDVFDGRWVVLPYIYNALKTLRWEGVHDAIWRDDRVKNVHYILGTKPWHQMDDDEKELVEVWWHAAEKGRKQQEKAKGIEDGH